MGRQPTRQQFSRAKFLLAALAGLAVAAPAALASPYTGSPAAHALVRSLFARERQDVAVDWVEHTGFYECPRRGRSPRIREAGRRPSPGCRPVRIEILQNLHNGEVTAEKLIDTAHGLPTQRLQATPAGRWEMNGASRCWRRTGAGIHAVQALVYTDEHITIQRRTRTRIYMRGVGPGLTEYDTITVHSRAILKTVITQPVPHLGISHVISTFTYPAHPFAIPSQPSPLC